MESLTEGNNNSNVTNGISIVLSFIGPMPAYVYECIRQISAVYSETIYLIYDQIDDELLQKLEAYKVSYVPYSTVRSSRFDARFKQTDFEYIPGLKGRELLFLRSYERFYLLDELMKQKGLTSIWFMEIDNLLYVNPNRFLSVLQQKGCVYSYHRPGHFNSGIFYVNDSATLQPMLSSLDTFADGFRSEMVALHSHYNKTKKDGLFPLVIPTPDADELFWKDYPLFDGHLFDGAILGIYYFGLDTYHTQGKIITKTPTQNAMNTRFLNIWKHGDMKWKKNSSGLFFPYFITHTKECLPIVNLHIHSKDLVAASSFTEKVDVY